MSFLVDSSSMSSSLPSPADVASSLQPVLIDMLAAAVDAASVVPAVLIDAHAVGADAQLFLACARAVVAGLAGASPADTRAQFAAAIAAACRRHTAVSAPPACMPPLAPARVVKPVVQAPDQPRTRVDGSRLAGAQTAPVVWARNRLPLTCFGCGGNHLERDCVAPADVRAARRPGLLPDPVVAAAPPAVSTPCTTGAAASSCGHAVPPSRASRLSEPAAALCAAASSFVPAAAVRASEGADRASQARAHLRQVLGSERAGLQPDFIESLQRTCALKDATTLSAATEHSHAHEQAMAFKSMARGQRTVEASPSTPSAADLPLERASKGLDACALQDATTLSAATGHSQAHEQATASKSMARGQRAVEASPSTPSAADLPLERASKGLDAVWAPSRLFSLLLLERESQGLDAVARTDALRSPPRWWLSPATAEAQAQVRWVDLLLGRLLQERESKGLGSPTAQAQGRWVEASPSTPSAAALPLERASRGLDAVWAPSRLFSLLLLERESKGLDAVVRTDALRSPPAQAQELHGLPAHGRHAGATSPSTSSEAKMPRAAESTGLQGNETPACLEAAGRTDTAATSTSASLEPAVPTPVPAAAGLYCGNVVCRQPLTVLRRCGRCKEAVYCSKACQIRAWKAGHRWECSSVPKSVGGQDLAESVRARCRDLAWDVEGVSSTRAKWSAFIQEYAQVVHSTAHLPVGIRLCPRDWVYWFHELRELLPGWALRAVDGPADCNTEASFWATLAAAEPFSGASEPGANVPAAEASPSPPSEADSPLAHESKGLDAVVRTAYWALQADRRECSSVPK